MERVRHAATAAPFRCRPGARLRGRRGARGRRGRGCRRRAEPQQQPELLRCPHRSTGSGSQSNPFGELERRANPYPSFGGGNGSGGSGSNNAGSGSLNASALAAKVDPAIVDIDSNLKYSDATAAGHRHGDLLNGLVLTNNHVIDGATSVTATVVTSGQTYTAKIIGYDSTDDVALLQLVGASDLKTVTLSNSTKAKVGEAVLALGNAGGRGRPRRRPRRAPSRHSTSRSRPATAARAPPRSCTA